MAKIKCESTVNLIHNYNLDLDNRIIYISSEGFTHSGEEAGVDFQMSMRFIKNLDILNTTGSSKILIKGSNIGGDWSFGQSMFDSVKASKSPVDYEICACACSMGSILPQACRKRYIHKHADFLIHLGTDSISGPLKTINSYIKYINTKTPIMYRIYAERCVNGEFFRSKNYSITDTEKYLAEQVDKKDDWWLSSGESVYYGFADEVI